MLEACIPGLMMHAGENVYQVVIQSAMQEATLQRR